MTAWRSSAFTFVPWPHRAAISSGEYLRVRAFVCLTCVCLCECVRVCVGVRACMAARAGRSGQGTVLLRVSLFVNLFVCLLAPTLCA